MAKFINVYRIPSWIKTGKGVYIGDIPFGDRGFSRVYIEKKGSNTAYLFAAGWKHAPLEKVLPMIVRKSNIKDDIVYEVRGYNIPTERATSDWRKKSPVRVLKNKSGAIEYAKKLYDRVSFSKDIKQNVFKDISKRLDLRKKHILGKPVFDEMEFHDRRIGYKRIVDGKETDFGIQLSLLSYMKGYYTPKVY